MESLPSSEQRAVHFTVWYTGQRVWIGIPEGWNDLPEDGVLAVVVTFNDGNSRLCMGDDWYGLLEKEGGWTIIHNSHDIEENKRRYPTVVWKRGQWTLDRDMQRVNAEVFR